METYSSLLIPRGEGVGGDSSSSPPFTDCELIIHPKGRPLWSVLNYLQGLEFSKNFFSDDDLGGDGACWVGEGNRHRFPGRLPLPHPLSDCSVAFDRQHNIVVQSRICGSSQMVQWLRVHLRVQGTGVQSPIVELRSPHAMSQLSLHDTILSPRTTTAESVCHSEAHSWCNKDLT